LHIFVLPIPPIVLEATNQFFHFIRAMHSSFVFHKLFSLTRLSTFHLTVTLKLALFMIFCEITALVCRLLHTHEAKLSP